MKNDIDLRKIPKSILVLFQRFHTTLFIVFVVTGLSIAVLMLNQLLSDASDTTAKGSENISSTEAFQTTIDRINDLHSSAEAPSSIPLPEGRTNPFVE
jgi:hypothetical protein